MSTKVVFLVCLAVYVQELKGQQIITIPTSASGVNGMSEYILYTHSQSWNTARKVCQSIGGNLAKLDTVALLEKIKEEKTGAWSSNWDHMWTGLHRAADQSLVFDDDACSPFNVDVSSMGVFKDANDFDFDATKQCLRYQKDSFLLERHDCKSPLNFICERKSAYCQYSSVNTGPAIVSQTNADASSCQTACNQHSGCYLTGNYSNTHCVLLNVQLGSDQMFEKNCYSVSTNGSDTESFKGTDDQFEIPTSCPLVTDPPPVTTTTAQSQPTSSVVELCPSSSYIYANTPSCSPEILVSQTILNVTVTETLTETSTETFSQTVTLPATVTRTMELTPSLNYVTETLTETATATLSVTATEVLNTCEQTLTVNDATSCVVSTQIITTQMTSTFSMTTVIDCSSVATALWTITPSCPETSVQIYTTTEIQYQQTSCACLHLTSEPTGVISPQSASSLLSSGLQSSVPVLRDVSQTTICKSYNLTSVDPVLLDALVQSIITDLTIPNKQNLSKNVRKKISASDARTSSKGIGFTAVSLIIVPFVLVILIDIPGIFNHFRSSFLSVKYKGTP